MRAAERPLATSPTGPARTSAARSADGTRRAAAAPARAPTGLREIHSSTRAACWRRRPRRDGDSAVPAGTSGAARQRRVPDVLAGRGRAAARGWAGGHRRRVTLHADALGMQDVYVPRLGDATYFSVRVEALLELDDVPLHTDWSAWADILAVTCPLGDATPFEEVRRLAAATALRSGPAVSADELRAVLAGDGAQRPDDPRRRGRRGRAAPSPEPRHGDHAQRRLGFPAAGAACPPRRPAADRVDHQQGRRSRPRPGVGATRRGGAAHAAPVVVPGPEAWLDEHRTVWRRLGHQTNHPHLDDAPYPRAPSALELFLDGLAGDLLFKGSSSPGGTRWPRPRPSAGAA